MELNEVKEGLRSKVTRFAKDIEPIYLGLNWKWDGTEPPNSDDIEKALNDLIDEMSEPSCIMTGGLEVFWEDKDDGSEIGKCYGIRFYYDDIRFY